MDYESTIYINGRYEVEIPVIKNKLLIDKYSQMWDIYRLNPTNKTALQKAIVNSKVKSNTERLGCNYID